MPYEIVFSNTAVISKEQKFQHPSKTLVIHKFVVLMTEVGTYLSVRQNANIIETIQELIPIRDERRFHWLVQQGGHLYPDVSCLQVGSHLFS